MFTDEHGHNVWDQLRQCDLRAFADKLTPEVFQEAARQTGVKLGVSALNLANLVWLSVSLALRPTASFTSVLTLTFKILYDSEDWPSSPLAQAHRNGQRRRKRRKGKRSKHDPRRDDPTGVSEEAFSKARQRMPQAFWMALLGLLLNRFLAQHESLVRWKQFRLLALDGTLVNMANHQALAEHYGTASNGKGKNRIPQGRMLLLHFPRVRIPLAHQFGALAQSEKTVAARLLNHLGGNDLLLMDRGFWSYGLFWQIQHRNAFFGIRRFKSAKLKTHKRLSAKERLVYYAPSDRKWRQQNLPKQILLRVIDYRIRGFRPSQIVTNVVDPKMISREEWIQMAEVNEAGEVLRPAGLYHRRWEIEITYLELKDVLGMERNLRSKTPASIEYEIAGLVTLYLLIRWLLVEAATAHGVNDPLRLSFTAVVRELTDLLPLLLVSSVAHVERVLLPRLLQRIASHVIPLRPGRHYPRPHDTKVKNKGKNKQQQPSKLPSAQRKAT